LIRTLSQTDLGGNLPKMVVNNLGSKTPKEWLTALKKGLDKLKKNSKK
jgi:hypothetical protein